MPPGSCSSGHLPVSGSLLWSVICAAGFYPCHGPDLLDHASPRFQDSTLSRRLARPWILPRGDCAGERLFIITLRRTRCFRQRRQEFSPAYTDHRLPWDVPPVNTFEGFPDAGQDPEGALSGFEFASSRAQPLTLWRSLLGVMSSLTPLIPGARLRMRSLQLCLNVAGPQPSDLAQISWDDSCHRDLLWWSDTSHLVVGVSLDLPQPCLVLFTDASNSGWGATLGNDQLSGLWTQDFSNFSINHRELLAILYAVRGFLHLLRCHSVSLFTDNTSALAYLHKQGGTRLATLNSMAQSSCASANLKVFVCSPNLSLGSSTSWRTPSVAVPKCLGSEWTLCQEVCRDLFRRWPVNIDLFATAMNHWLQAYFSPVLDPQALATDAMSQSWDGLQAYAFPPLGFIPKVRQSRNLKVTLFDPYWPMKPWFPDVLELLVSVTVLLPLRKDLLRQPHFHHFHRNLPALHMTGFRIVSEQRAISASLRQWRASLSTASGLPPM